MEVKLIHKEDFIRLFSDVDQNPKGWDGKHPRPIIVDFFGTWCGPCKALAPILQEVADEFDGQVDVYKVDVDQDEELTNLFGIRMVPTLLFARPTDTAPQLMLGVMGKAELTEKVKTIFEL